MLNHKLKKLSKAITKDLKAIEKKFYPMQIEATKKIIRGEDPYAENFKAYLKEVREATKPFLTFKSCETWRDVYNILTTISKEEINKLTKRYE